MLGHHHHAYDVIFGGLLGSLMALAGYKLVFVSVWDARTNSVTWLGLRREEDEGVLTIGEGSIVIPGQELLPTRRLEVQNGA